MKYLILAIVLISCKTMYVTQEAKLTISGNKVSFKPVGNPKPVSDTVMLVKIIRRK